MASPLKTALRTHRSKGFPLSRKEERARTMFPPGGTREKLRTTACPQPRTRRRFLRFPQRSPASSLPAPPACCAGFSPTLRNGKLSVKPPSRSPGLSAPRGPTENIPMGPALLRRDMFPPLVLHPNHFCKNTFRKKRHKVAKNIFFVKIFSSAEKKEIPHPHEKNFCPLFYSIKISY